MRFRLGYGIILNYPLSIVNCFPVPAAGMGAASAPAAVTAPFALELLVEAVDEVARRPHDKNRHTGVNHIFQHPITRRIREPIW